jgi:hypothetical protein
LLQPVSQIKDKTKKEPVGSAFNERERTRMMVLMPEINVSAATMNSVNPVIIAP